MTNIETCIKANNYSRLHRQTVIHVLTDKKLYTYYLQTNNYTRTTCRQTIIHVLLADKQLYIINGLADKQLYSIHVLADK